MKLFILALAPVCILAQQVIVAPYYPAGIGTQQLTTSAGTDTSMDVLAVGDTYKMLLPRSGKISAFSVYLADTSSLTAIYFSTDTCTSSSSGSCTVWTPNYTAQITGPFFANQLNTFTLASPITNSKFDGISVRAEWTSGHATNLGLFSSQILSTENCWYQLNQAKQTTFTVSSMTEIANNGCPVVSAWMTRPDFVGIGDSIMVTQPSTDSTASAGVVSYPLGSIYSIPNSLQSALPITLNYQNQGIGGQTTTQILARFTSDVVNLKPSSTIIDGGVNDVFLNCASTGCTGGEISTIESNLASLMSDAQSAGIKAYVLLIGPWNTPNGTNGRMTSVDTINANTISVAPSYGATVVDCRCLLGQFRSGGSAGNCWDWQTEYLYAGDGLGVHPNSAGVAVIGTALAAAFSLSPFSYSGVAKLAGESTQK